MSSDRQQAETDPKPTVAPAAKRRSRPAVWFFVLVFGLILFAFASVVTGALFLEAVGEDMDGSARVWVAGGVALVAALVWPGFLAMKLGKSAMSGARIFTGWNLVLSLAVIAFTPSLAQRALRHHGAWPSELFGARSDAWARSAARVAGLLPGDEQGLETDSDADAGVDGGLAPPSGPLGPKEVFATAADAVAFIGVRAKVEPDSLEAKIMGFLGIKEMDGHGSGFAVSPDGLIVTNHHVIGRARSATVRLRDGRSFSDVTILALDPDNDLALIKVEADGLKTLALAEQDDIAVGASAFAIGSPLGLDFTLTSGIVSARREQQQTSLLQMQTTIAPGSSGGPVLDDRAQLIGVSTATRGAGLNLAVHVRHVRALLEAERSPKRLEPWREDVELTAMEVEGGKTLPTDRAQLEFMAKFAAKAVEGCIAKLPEEGAKVELKLSRQLFAKPKLSSNLGAEAEGCIKPSLAIISMQASQVLGGARGAERVLCTFKGLNVEGDPRDAERRRLELVLSTAPTKGAQPVSDAGKGEDAAAARDERAEKVRDALRRMLESAPEKDEDAK